MLTDKQILKRFKRSFEYLEEYDKLGDYPDKKVNISITIPLRLKKKLDKIKNKSELIERLIEKSKI